MMFDLAPNIDLVFTEAGDPADRIRAASRAGFTSVEMWTHSDKDLDALAAALSETGVQIVAQLAEPRAQFLLDDDHEPFFAGLNRCLAAADKLSIPRLVIGGGGGVPRFKREPSTQKLVEIFTRIAERVAGTGVTVVIEAVNERVDHPGSFLNRTEDSAFIARAVGSPDVGILYDLYHSAAEGEDVSRAIAENADVIRYVQLADSPGRGEPGSGSIDWPARLAELAAAGYTGPLGLEFVPTKDSAAAVLAIRKLVVSA
jgi:hydroxypyruvate isomerase